jgi:large subunit ribosomal protein L9
MKVILLQDVANVGRRFEVKDVPTGHALNMLIPRRMAEPATPENLKRLAARTAHKAAETAAVNASFADVIARLGGTTETMTVEANEQGHLYEGQKAADIAALLQSKGFNITPAQVVVDHPIKETGEHTITLREGAHTATFTLAVTGK